MKNAEKSRSLMLIDIFISDHARYEIVRRQLSEDMVRSVAENPQQVVKLDKGRRICQTKYYDSSEDKEMLLRLICEERGNRLFVITAYRASKINRYWTKEG